ncbi:hypothetical protein CC2G_013970 [Coprinopsis cinerea AmutBmut pab1-1]|nr:hypothetical protein CC2G_013970 [Coprinopsis cinerea AmutBmut pab1-1]
MPMRRILLRKLLALGAARYSRAFGHGSGNVETAFYSWYDVQPATFPPPEPPNDEEDDELASSPSLAPSDNPHITPAPNQDKG